MKTLENAETEIKSDKGNLTFSGLAIACVNNPPKDGYTPEEMRTRIRLIEVLEKGGDEIKLEDSDAEKLKSLVSDMKWAVLHKDIVKFSDAIKAL